MTSIYMCTGYWVVKVEIIIMSLLTYVSYLLMLSRTIFEDLTTITYRNGIISYIVTQVKHF